MSRDGKNSIGIHIRNSCEFREFPIQNRRSRAIHLVRQVGVLSNNIWHACIGLYRHSAYRWKALNLTKTMVTLTLVRGEAGAWNVCETFGGKKSMSSCCWSRKVFGGKTGGTWKVGGTLPESWESPLYNGIWHACIAQYRHAAYRWQALDLSCMVRAVWPSCISRTRQERQEKQLREFHPQKVSKKCYGGTSRNN